MLEMLFLICMPFNYTACDWDLEYWYPEDNERWFFISFSERWILYNPDSVKCGTTSWEPFVPESYEDDRLFHFNNSREWQQAKEYESTTIGIGTPWQKMMYVLENADGHLSGYGESGICR